MKTLNFIENKELGKSSDTLEIEEFQRHLKKWTCDVRKDRITVDVLINKIEKGRDKISGGIVLDADFQRNHKFTTIKESSIIESLLLGIPIPTIFLSRNTIKDVALFNVIDGQHRLRSVERFVNGNYRLTGLKYLNQLNGKKYNQLPNFIKNQLLYDSQIDISSIDISENEELEYEVFLRFNQETNPLTKQELLDVLYRSGYATWIKNEFIPQLIENEDFNIMFNNTGKRLRDRTINYGVYVCLAYWYFGLLEGKNDSPIYVGKYMRLMKELDDLEEIKSKTKEFLYGFIEFYKKVSVEENIQHIFSKEFLNKKRPQGNHIFLISFLIPLTLSYKYILEKRIAFDSKDHTHQLYNAIADGMRNARFGDFGGISSTSYKTQFNCISEIKKCIDNIL